MAAARTKEKKASFIVRQRRGDAGTRGEGQAERKTSGRARRSEAGARAARTRAEFYTVTWGVRERGWHWDWQMFRSIEERRVHGGTDVNLNGEEKDEQARSGRFSGGRSAHLQLPYGQRPALEGAVRRCIAVPRQHMSCYRTSAQKDVTENDGRQRKAVADGWLARFHAGRRSPPNRRRWSVSVCPSGLCGVRRGL